MSERNGSQRLVAREFVSLFLGVLCVLVVFNRGHGTSVDEGHVFETARALVTGQTWRMEQPLNERWYSRYSPLPSMLAAPLYALGRAIGGETAARVLAFQLNAVGTALAAVCLAVIGAATGASRGACFFVALSYGLGSLAFPYAGSLYTQPLAAALLVVTLVALAAGWNWFSGIMWMLTCWCREECLVLLPALVGFDAVIGKSRRGKIGLIVGSLGAVGLWIITRVLRGDPLAGGGYTGEAFVSDPVRGVYGLLLSAGKGLLVFAPLSFLGGLAALRYWPRWWRPLATGILAWLLLIGAWWTWHGGYCWGPRLLLPVLPLLHLGLAPLWDSFPRGRRALAALLAASVLLQVVASGGHPYPERVGPRGVIASEMEHVFVPSVAPVWTGGISGGDWWWYPGNSGPYQFTGLFVAGAVLVAGIWLLLGPFRSIVRDFEPLRAPDHGAGLRLAGATLLVLGVGAGPVLNIVSGAVSADPDTGRMVVYAPLKGGYEFHVVPSSRSVPRLIVDGTPVTGSLSRGRIDFVCHLDRGEHELVLEGGQAAALFWTSPGGVFYREPIPRLYLGGASEQPLLALLRKAREWSWLLSVLGAYALLWTWWRPERPANATDQTG